MRYVDMFAPLVILKVEGVGRSFDKMAGAWWDQNTLKCGLRSRDASIFPTLRDMPATRRT